MKLINIIPGVPNLVARINEELPPEIRLWSIVRLPSPPYFRASEFAFSDLPSFECRTRSTRERPCHLAHTYRLLADPAHDDRTCDSRKYTYFFPSYLMIPPKPGSGLANTLKAQGTECPAHPFWEGVDNEQQATPQDDLRRKRAYRIAPEQLASLREAANKFEGSHNFHNFTVGRDFRDRSCQRFLKSIEVGRDVQRGGIASLTHILDSGPCGVWRYRMDRRPVAWTKFYAAPSEYG